MNLYSKDKIQHKELTFFLPEVKNSTGKIKDSVSIPISMEINQKIKLMVGNNFSGVLTVLFTALSVVLERLTGNEDVIIKVDASKILPAQPCYIPIYVDRNQECRSLLREAREQMLTLVSNETITQASSNVGIGWNIDNDDTSSLFLNVNNEGEDLRVNILYEKNVYLEIAVKRIAAEIEKVLELLILPEKKISDYDLFQDNEIKELKKNGRGKITNYPHIPLIEQFFQNAAEFPDKKALSFQNRTWTYSELKSVTRKLGAALKHTFDIRKGDKVLCIFERSDFPIISYLAILQIGAVFVPVDHSYPENRILEICEDADVNIILSESSLMEKLFGAGLPIYCLDMTFEMLEDIDIENIEYNINTPAYIMYTSGSAGKPKGTLVPQKAIMRLVKDQNFISFTSNDNVLQTASLGFDGSVIEIWGALLNGGHLIIIPKDDLLNIRSFECYVKNHKISKCFLSTSLFHQLAFENPQAFDGISTLLVGGDVLLPKYVNAVIEACENITVVNGYGPTENTTFSTTYTLSEPVDLYSVPIGVPLHNSSAYVLSAKGEFLPSGIIGEIVVGGDGLALEYIGLPELTEKCFVSLSQFENQRFYKTGDQGYIDDHHNIHFVGRNDYEIKIRGFRIDIQELELMLNTIDGVEMCAVICDSRQLDKELLAFIQTSRQIDYIKQEMTRKLPNFMIPSQIYLFEKLPLNANGKIDRNKLLDSGAKENNVYEKEEVVIENISEVQRSIISIWENVLEKKGISIHDDFFECGGHSLIATRIVSRIYTDLNVEIKVSEIFMNPTVLELSAIVEKELLGENTNKQELKLEKIHKAEHYEVSNSQKRMWILHNLENPAIYNISRAYAIKSELNIQAYTSALQKLMDRHEVLRTTFLIVDDQLRQQVKENIDLPLVYHDFRNTENPEKEAINIYLKESDRPFDLRKGPLFHVHLIQLGENDFIHLFNTHHIISDEWSGANLLNDLIMLYNLEVVNEINEPSSLDFQYKDFAVWQNKWMSTQEAKQNKEYWLKQLKDVTSESILPYDFRRPVIKTYNGSTFIHEFNVELKDKIEDYLKKNDVSFYMFCNSVFKILLHKYSGETDIVFGTPITERSFMELENQIGLYLNTIVLRDKINPQDTFREFLTQSKENLLDALNHKKFPFDALVDELKVTRDISKNPLFEVMTVGHNPPQIKSDEIDLVAYDLNWERELNRSQFDISVDYLNVGGMGIDIEYNTDLFQKSTIELMAKNFETLLQSVIEDDNEIIGNIQFTQLKEQNVLSSDPPMLEELLNLIFNNNSGNTAIYENQEAVSFRELNIKINEVFRFLTNINRDKPICFVFEKRSLYVIAALAALRTGHIFILKELFQINDRIEEEMTIISDTDLEANLELSSEKEWEESALPVADENQVCIIYSTSGSTGKPKLVQWTRFNLANYLNAVKDQLPMNGSDLCLSHAMVSFDLFIEETLLPLIQNAAVRMSKWNCDIDILKNELESNDITLISTTPVIIRHLEIEKLKLDKMRLIISGGDVLSLNDISQIPDHIEVYNSYGPTECTIACIYGKVNKKSKDRIPLGQLISGVDIQVVDNNLNAVPEGITGELIIMGNAISQGYINNDDNNPFIDYNGKLAYRTGDLGYRINNNFYFTGRINNQFKINGKRIYLKELENKIKNFKECKEVVMYPKFENDKVQAVNCYIQFSREAPKLLDFQMMLLESYLQISFPINFYSVQEWAFNNNGQISLDKTVSVPLEMGTNDNEYYVESTLIRVAENVLKYDNIESDHNFFDLGGNSLLAIKFLKVLEKELGIEICLRDILVVPTFKHLALLICKKKTLKYKD